jgi:hypothetical protein
MGNNGFLCYVKGSVTEVQLIDPECCSSSIIGQVNGITGNLNN